MGKKKKTQIIADVRAKAVAIISSNITRIRLKIALIFSKVRGFVEKKYKDLRQNKLVFYFTIIMIIILPPITEYFMLEADFNNYSELKAPIFIDPVMQKSIDLIIQLNTYLFGLSGALFAVLGILEKSKQKSTIHIYLVVFSCVMICMSFFYGYKSLYEILNQVSQYQIALKPRQSVSIMYLAWEFYHFFAAVVAAGVAYIIRNPESANE